LIVTDYTRPKTFRKTHALIETLEDRRMLSATLADPAAAIAAAHLGITPVEAPVKILKAKPKPVLTTTPSLVHNYFGKLKTSGIIFGLGSRQLDLELIITDQTISTLTGHFFIAGHDADATLHGFEKTNGKFSYSTNSDGFTFKIEGRVSNNGNTLGGHASVRLSAVSIFKTSGGFVANVNA
jgi:hypothetical protein